MEQTLNYNQLAAAVIIQAIRDLTKITYCSKPKQVPKIKESARDFLLKPNEALAFWCNVAEIDMASVVAKSQEVVRLWDETGQFTLFTQEEEL